MALPNLQLATETLTLPLSKQLVKYRGYTVGEEKALISLYQNENRNADDVIAVVSSIINNCSFGTVNAQELAPVDFEYLFLKLRASSKGSDSSVIFICKNMLENGDFCDAENNIEFNINDAEYVDGGFRLDYEIPDSDYVVNFRSPTLSDISALEAFIEGKDEITQVDVVEWHFVYYFDNVVNTELNETMKPESVEEITNFMNSLPSLFFDSFEEFFIQKMPKISLPIAYTCHSCGKEHKTKLEGLDDFF